VAQENSEAVAPLLREVKSWVREQEKVRSLLGPLGESEPDPEVLEQLRTLGYIGGGGR
jgi:hypothetical protein